MTPERSDLLRRIIALVVVAVIIVIGLVVLATSAEAHEHRTCSFENQTQWVYVGEGNYERWETRYDHQFRTVSYWWSWDGTKMKRTTIWYVHRHYAWSGWEGMVYMHQRASACLVRDTPA